MPRSTQCGSGGLLRLILEICASRGRNLALHLSTRAKARELCNALRGPKGPLFHKTLFHATLAALPQNLLHATLFDSSRFRSRFHST
jgi:hypothetical protein